MKKHPGKLLRTLALSLLFITGNVVAEVPPAQLKEIAHLMAFMQNTDCLLERNGTKYASKKALLHIKRKYEYFTDKIHTTEDFIKYSATKSEISGKFYLAHCPKEPTMKLSDWLYLELKDYREKRMPIK
ncbi:MAG: hypothetical protein BMS9Abin26_1146 [Gammaproteobacteria bacterium]|nr:MAG: hypothetical protein BMS9Abin26_1146 [Gammaproteobacteria bacterium]